MPRPRRLHTTLALAASIAVAACSPAPQPDAAAIVIDPAVSTPAAPTDAHAATDRASTAARAPQAPYDPRHAAALGDAVATVHGYLRHAGAGERADAEARWAYNRLPPASEEAGLRTLQLKALRIENDAPRALDADAVPAAVEVPVRLRATLADGATQRYTGWYRVRRNPVTTTWELTAVSLQPVLR